jgi:hypothetical protein
LLSDRGDGIQVDGSTTRVFAFPVKLAEAEEVILQAYEEKAFKYIRGIVIALQFSIKFLKISCVDNKDHIMKKLALGRRTIVHQGSTLNIDDHNYRVLLCFPLNQGLLSESTRIYIAEQPQNTTNPQLHHEIEVDSKISPRKIQDQVPIRSPIDSHAEVHQKGIDTMTISVSSLTKNDLRTCQNHNMLWKGVALDPSYIKELGSIKSLEQFHVDDGDTHLDPHIKVFVSWLNLARLGSLHGSWVYLVFE